MLILVILLDYHRDYSLYSPTYRNVTPYAKLNKPLNHVRLNFKQYRRLIIRCSLHGVDSPRFILEFSPGVSVSHILEAFLILTLRSDLLPGSLEVTLLTHARTKFEN